MRAVALLPASASVTLATALAAFSAVSLLLAHLREKRKRLAEKRKRNKRKNSKRKTSEEGEGEAEEVEAYDESGSGADREHHRSAAQKSQTLSSSSSRNKNGEGEEGSGGSIEGSNLEETSTSTTRHKEMLMSSSSEDEPSPSSSSYSQPPKKTSPEKQQQQHHFSSVSRAIRQIRVKVGRATKKLGEHKMMLGWNTKSAGGGSETERRGSTAPGEEKKKEEPDDESGYSVVAAGADSSLHHPSPGPSPVAASSSSSSSCHLDDSGILEMSRDEAASCSSCSEAAAAATTTTLSVEGRLSDREEDGSPIGPHVVVGETVETTNRRTTLVLKHRDSSLGADADEIVVDTENLVKFDIQYSTKTAELLSSPDTSHNSTQKTTSLLSETAETGNAESAAAASETMETDTSPDGEISSPTSSFADRVNSAKPRPDQSPLYKPSTSHCVIDTTQLSPKMANALRAMYRWQFITCPRIVEEEELEVEDEEEASSSSSSDDEELTTLMENAADSPELDSLSPKSDLVFEQFHAADDPTDLLVDLEDDPDYESIVNNNGSARDERRQDTMMTEDTDVYSYSRNVIRASEFSDEIISQALLQVSLLLQAEERVRTRSRLAAVLSFSEQIARDVLSSAIAEATSVTTPKRVSGQAVLEALESSVHLVPLVSWTNGSATKTDGRRSGSNSSLLTSAPFTSDKNGRHRATDIAPQLHHHDLLTRTIDNDDDDDELEARNKRSSAASPRELDTEIRRETITQTLELNSQTGFISGAARPSHSNEAFVTTATASDAYNASGTLVLGLSLRAAATKKELVVLVDEDVSPLIR